MNLDYSTVDQQSLQSLGAYNALANYSEIMSRQRQEQQDREQQRQIGLQQALYEQKVKEAEAAAAQSKLSNPDYFNQINRGTMGNAQSSEVAGRKAVATESSDTQVALADNFAKLDANKQRQVEEALTQASVRFKAVRNSPQLYQQEAQQFMQQHPEFAKLLNPKQDLGSQLDTYLNNLTSRKVDSDIKIQGRLQEQTLQNQGQIGAASVRASAIGASGANQDLKQQEVTRKRLSALQNLYQKQLDGMLPKDPKRLALQQELDQVASDLKQLGSGGQSQPQQPTQAQYNYVPGKGLVPVQ